MEEKVIKVETNDGAKFEVPFNVLYNIKGYEWDSDPSFIDLDSTTFTRVLHFLETYQGEETGADYEYDTAKADELFELSKKLKISQMEQFFSNEILRFETAKKREISWEEFCNNQRRNSFWILVDGHIYDITKWIEFNDKQGEIPHPGGSTPLQAIKVDSSYFFEIYHATNECYTLMKNFYIGRLRSSDLEKVPPSKHPVSSEFVKHLRSFTKCWTIDNQYP